MYYVLCLSFWSIKLGCSRVLKCYYGQFKVIFEKKLKATIELERISINGSHFISNIVLMELKSLS